MHFAYVSDTSISFLANRELVDNDFRDDKVTDFSPIAVPEDINVGLVSTGVVDIGGDRWFDSTYMRNMVSLEELKTNGEWERSEELGSPNPAHVGWVDDDDWNYERYNVVESFPSVEDHIFGGRDFVSFAKFTQDGNLDVLLDDRGRDFAVLDVPLPPRCNPRMVAVGGKGVIVILMEDGKLLFTELEDRDSVKNMFLGKEPIDLGLKLKSADDVKYVGILSGEEFPDDYTIITILAGETYTEFIVDGNKLVSPHSIDGILSISHAIRVQGKPIKSGR